VQRFHERPFQKCAPERLGAQRRYRVSAYNIGKER
jgi:hypothetical protein